MSEKRPITFLKRIIPWLSYWTPLVLLAELPPLSSWLQNKYQVTLIDLLLPIILSLLTATVVACIFYPLSKKTPLGSFVGAILTVLVIGDQYESKLSSLYPAIKALNPIPQLKSWEGTVISLAFIVLVALMARYVGLVIDRLVETRNWKAKDLVGGITVVIVVTFVLQLYPTVRTITTEWGQFSYKPTSTLGTQAALSTGTEKPDIYYIVLDRYASQDVLQQQFGFDNSAFIKFLTDNGYYSNPNAHQNYPYTTMSIASTLNADYHTDIVQKFAGSPDQTIFAYHEAIRNATVIKRLKSLGYTYDELGSWYEATNEAPLADHVYQPEGLLTVLGHTYTMNTFSKNLLTQSPFWRLTEHGISLGNFQVLAYGGLGEQQATPYKLDALNDLADQPAGGRFIFAHVLVPHNPYYYNADGSLNPNTGDDNVGELIKQKYVNQVKYINSQMEPLLAKINKNSGGKAIVILQSDEGPYPASLNDDLFDGNAIETELANGSMLNWSDANLQMKYGNLAAYHIPESTTADLTQGADNVNVFRLVLNRYFKDTLPYLPKCYYAYPDGRSEPFVYRDITKRLTGTANPLCSANSDFGKN
ncbi:MAG: sulfatase-like hydrolase/transferase [bacterium]